MMLPISRRDLLARAGVGMGLLGLRPLFAADDFKTTPPDPAAPLAPRPAHFAAKAKRVIHLFANGGPSQVDTWDHKPALAKYANKTLPTENLKTERKTGAALPSPFKFKRYGRERAGDQRTVR